MGAEEGILYAECDLELGILTKLRHDFAGHYNRPDIFQLHVNRTAPHLYTVHGGAGREELPAPPKETLAKPAAQERLLSSPAAEPDETPADGRGHCDP